MVSTQKALASLSISGGVVLFRLLFFQQLPDLLYISPILMLYCILDLSNSIDMIIHHIATVMLNITFFYTCYHLEYLDKSDQQSISEIVCSFFMVEVSTIFLALIHLGYRNIVMRFLFVVSFVYYRIISLSYTLYNYYQSKYIDQICQDSEWCRLRWYLGSIPVVALNYYWFGLIVNKVVIRKLQSS